LLLFKVFFDVVFQKNEFRFESQKKYFASVITLLFIAASLSTTKVVANIKAADEILSIYWCLGKFIFPLKYIRPSIN